MINIPKEFILNHNWEPQILLQELSRYRCDDCGCVLVLKSINNNLTHGYLHPIEGRIDIGKCDKKIVVEDILE